MEALLTKEEIKETVESITENKLHNYDQLYEELDDAIYYHYDMNCSDKEAQELYERTKEKYDLEKIIRKALVERVNDKYFFDGDVKSIGVVIGIQHINIPFKYYLEYIVENVEDETDIKGKLQEAGIVPHAWGIMTDTGSWGNYWFEVITKENIEDADLDLLTVLASQSPSEWIS